MKSELIRVFLFAVSGVSVALAAGQAGWGFATFITLLALNSIVNSPRA